MWTVWGKTFVAHWSCELKFGLDLVIHLIMWVATERGKCNDSIFMIWNELTSNPKGYVVYMQSSSSSSHFSTKKQQLTRILKHLFLVSEHSSSSQGLGEMIDKPWEKCFETCYSWPFSCFSWPWLLFHEPKLLSVEPRLVFLGTSSPAVPGPKSKQ